MSVSRRTLLKIAGATGAGLAVGDVGVSLADVGKAASSAKLAGAKEFTTACNFCSCGCGMVAHVRDGQLLNLEGDPDHVINQGALCSKGAAMKATHESDRRLKKPMYRAPGSDRWEEISWDKALDKIAAKVKQVRDSSWIASEKDKDKDGNEVEFAVNRTDALGFLGGAQNTNEECYAFAKMARLFGTAYVEHQARL
jgi:formate dehydrogenase major subunit